MDMNVDMDRETLRQAIDFVEDLPEQLTDGTVDMNELVATLAVQQARLAHILLRLLERDA